MPNYSNVTDFLAQSSVHGLPRLVNPGKVSRVAWSLFFLCALTTYLFHSSTMITQFFDEPSTMNYLPHGHPFRWPDMIICSKQQLSPSKFISDKVLNHTDSRELASAFNKLRKLWYGSGEWYWAYTFRSYPIWSTITIAKLFDHFGNKDTLLKNRRNNEDQKSELIPHWNHFSCYRVVINATKYQNLYEPGWLPIYTDITEVKDLNDTWKWSSNHLYKNHFAEHNRFELERGAMIYFVAQGEYPTEQSPSVVLKPTRNYRISVTMKGISTVNKKKSPCVAKPKFTYMVNYLLGNKRTVAFTESEKTCAYHRIQERLIKNCNCTSYRFPVPAIHANVKFCFDFNDWLQKFNETDAKPNIDYNVFDKQFKKIRVCIKNNDVMTTEDFIKCSPKRICDTHVYSVQPISWLMDRTDVGWGARNELKIIHPPANTNMSNHEYDETIAMKYLTWVQIERAETNSLLVEEQFTYFIKNLISDLGGMLGFYLGISVLTMCELLEIVARVSNFLCGRINKKKRKKLANLHEDNLDLGNAVIP